MLDAAPAVVASAPMIAAAVAAMSDHLLVPLLRQLKPELLEERLDIVHSPEPMHHVLDVVQLQVWLSRLHELRRNTLTTILQCHSERIAHGIHGGFVLRMRTHV